MSFLKYSVKFILQSTRHKTPARLIRCYVRYNGQRAQFGTNLKIEPKNWNAKSQEARKTALFDGKTINDGLEKIRDFVRGIFEPLDAYPEPAEVEARCKEFIIRGEAAQAPAAEIEARLMLIGYAQQIYDRTESGERKISRGKRAGQPYKKNSLRAYSNFLLHVRKFAELKGVADFPFEAVDKKFYEDFRSYLFKAKGSVGYFSTMVKVIKSILNDGLEDNLHSNVNHKTKYFTKPEYESDTVYLNVDQLTALHEFDYKKPHLRHAVDLFLVGSWTGLRFSDYSNLHSVEVEGNFVRVETEKTGERVAIPMHPILRAIYDKYGQKFPPGLSLQKLNENIKVAAKEAGLTYETRQRTNVGGVNVFKVVPFNDRISTHAARRSFATNMFKAGIPSIIIMAITGHKTEASFLKYIRVSNEEKAQIMQAFYEKLGWV